MHTVYWIHLKEHDNPKTQGYVGVTSRELEDRFKEHKARTKRLPTDVEISALRSGLSEKEAFALEEEFRPRWNIGWNKSPGGRISRRPKGIHTSGWKLTKQTKQKIRLATLGDKNPMKKRTGGKHQRARAFTIDGVRFSTLGEAAAKFNITYGTVYNRLNHADWPSWSYINTTE